VVRDCNIQQRIHAIENKYIQSDGPVVRDCNTKHLTRNMWYMHPIYNTYILPYSQMVVRDRKTHHVYAMQNTYNA